MKSSANPQAKPINQRRGPTTGNMNPGGKRGEFESAKAQSGSQRSALANMITDAFASRGRGMRGFRDATVEPVKATVNVGRGPRRGNQA